MSDNSSGSSGSSSNSWTLLSPEEASIDSAGPVDDGTESTGDAPSLSEEVAGISLEVKTSESESQLETIFTEEGHQVCQETSPEFCEGTASGIDPEICAPVIHDTITSSPPDNDLLGAVPFSIATESSLFLSVESVLVQEPLSDVEPTSDLPPEQSPAPGATEMPPPPGQTETTFSPGVSHSDIPENICPISGINLTHEISAGSSAPESPSPSPPSEADAGSPAEGPLSEDSYPEPVGPSVLEEEPTVQREVDLEESVDVVGEPEPHPGEGDGLRLRHMQHSELHKHSSNEEEEEEEDFKLPEMKEEKPGFSLTHLIIGALVLLCLGSLFFSEDLDGSDLSDQELLEKLAQENKKISMLEAQLQSQKEELDKALRKTADKGATDKENAKMKEELSALPALKEELEVLKARIKELIQLTGKETTETSPCSVTSSPGVPSDGQGATGSDRWWEKLKRQKTLLEESRRRLEDMKKQGWNKKDLSKSLVEMQQRLSEQVEHLGKRDEWKRKNKEHKEGRKEWGGESNQWKVEGMGDKDKDAGLKCREDLKEHREEWEHKKDERKLEREKRKQERPWQTKPDHHHQQTHQKQHIQRQEPASFWWHQEKKLRMNRIPPKRCPGVSACADAEGLVPVKLLEFQAILESYLKKLEGVSEENLQTLRSLIKQFFHDGIFCHDRMLFSEFAEDVSDILEDLADELGDKKQGVDDDALEKEMEQFEREALWKFAAPVA